MPADIAVNSISDYQLGELKRLEAWLYKQRIKARIEKDGAGLRQERDEAKTLREAEQPALFEL